MKIISLILKSIGIIGILGLIIWGLWKIEVWLALGFIFFMLWICGEALETDIDEFEILFGDREE